MGVDKRSETCGDTGAPVVAKKGEPGGGVANRAAGHEALTGTRTVKGECWTGTAEDSDGCNGHNQCVRPREVATHEFGIVLESFIPHSGDKALDEVERSVAGYGQAEQRGDGRAPMASISAKFWTIAFRPTSSAEDQLRENAAPSTSTSGADNSACVRSWRGKHCGIVTVA